MRDVGEALDVEAGGASHDVVGGGAEVMQQEFCFDDFAIGRWGEEATLTGGNGEVGVGEAEEAVVLRFWGDGAHG